jgi:protein-S-isoprenylcysteine O-methyltransferase
MSHLMLGSTIYLVPLILNPNRLLHPGPWFVLAIAVVMLGSQPQVRASEALARAGSDRGSALAIFVTMIAAQLAASIDFALRPLPPAGATMVAGMSLAVGGLAIRLWAIRTLGTWFTSTVRVVDGQEVVRAGPYRWLRHPSYAGAVLIASGSCLALGSLIGVALVAVVCLPAYLYRIGVEERVLETRLGIAYRDYREASWALVPGIC